MSRKIVLCSLVLMAVSAAAVEIPSVSADLGECSARFKVTDGAKPIYNAKVRTRIKYGAFGARKLDLEVGTDASGQAMVTNLPAYAKKPMPFEVVSGDVSRTVLFEPEKECKAQFDVQLRKPASNPQP